MRNHIISWRGVTLAVVLTVLAFASAGSDDRDHGPSARHYVPVQRGNGFSASGRFSGTLSGDILVGTETYHLTDDTILYELGRGLVKPGEFVGDRMVFVAGAHNSGYDTVWMVIIRPVTDATDPVLPVTISDGTEPK